MDSKKKLKKFWKNKKVFITGHTGFKGSWMSILLNILGAEIYGYSLKPDKKSLFILYVDSEPIFSTKTDSSIFPRRSDEERKERILNSFSL